MADANTYLSGSSSMKEHTEKLQDTEFFLGNQTLVLFNEIQPRNFNAFINDELSRAMSKIRRALKGEKLSQYQAFRIYDKLNEIGTAIFGGHNHSNEDKCVLIDELRNILKVAEGDTSRRVGNILNYEGFESEDLEEDFKEFIMMFQATYNSDIKAGEKIEEKVREEKLEKQKEELQPQIDTGRVVIDMEYGWKLIDWLLRDRKHLEVDITHASPKFKKGMVHIEGHTIIDSSQGNTDYKIFIFKNANLILGDNTNLRKIESSWGFSMSGKVSISIGGNKSVVSLDGKFVDNGITAGVIEFRNATDISIPDSLAALVNTGRIVIKAKEGSQVRNKDTLQSVIFQIL